MQQIVQHFWKRWHREYLSELQMRNKWKHGAQSNIEVGSIVLIKVDNSPPLRWPLERVTELHSGQDGIVRVVTVKTNNRLAKGAVSKVCMSPFSNVCILNKIEQE